MKYREQKALGIVNIIDQCIAHEGKENQDIIKRIKKCMKELQRQIRIDRLREGKSI